MILSSFVWIGYQHVTDGQKDIHTDGIAVAYTALCIASNAAEL